MKKKTLLVASALLLILPLIYLMIVYPGLPETIPIHFRLDGTPNGFATKDTLIWAIASLGGTGIIACLLFSFLPQIDPKLKGKPDNRFNKVVLLVAGIMSTLQIAIVYSCANNGLAIGKIAGVVIGIAICVCGNLMYNIRPNYFFGIRVPWTLDSEANWRATHHLAGKLWFFGGISIALFCLIFPGTFSAKLMLAAVLLLAIVPITYSFIYFRNHAVK